MDIVGSDRIDEERRRRREFAIVMGCKGGAWMVVVFVSSAIAESPLLIGELRNLQLAVADDRPE